MLCTAKKEVLTNLVYVQQRKTRQNKSPKKSNTVQIFHQFWSLFGNF